jgi:hypothetical protein
MDRRKNRSTSARPGRRQFLSAAAAALAAPYVITTAALGAGNRPPASERIVMGGIGIGNMGSGDQGAFLGRDEVQYVAVCDVRKEFRDRAKDRVDQRYGNQDCAAYNDFRELLARKDIDAVHVATPDHWHGILVVQACRSGKDVYCQKPESLTVREGRAMVEAARRYGRVVSGGSQRVLGDTGALARKCWAGEFGPIKEVYVACGMPSKPCNLPGEPVPDGIDWDMWLGPAPDVPYHPYRISGSYAINGTSWRSWRDYSGGGMTDWGAHRFGGATFAVGLHHEQPIEVLPPDDKDRKYLTYRFANGLLMYHGSPKGAVEVVGNPAERVPARPMPEYKGASGIYGDFLHCVRTRQKPFRDIAIAHNTMVVCHLGIIAYQLNRPLKWDPAKEEFPGDEPANRLLDRARREPWTL